MIEGRKLTLRENINLSIYWFASNFQWGALLVLLLPGDVRLLAPTTKATTLGLITAFAAIFGLVVPLISGALSDRCTNRLGRRRPFLIWGVPITMLGLMSMGAVVTLRDALPGAVWLYTIAFVIVQIGSNIALGAYMGVIPDLVPENQRGAASGFMALMTQSGTLAGAIVVGMVLGGASPLLRYGVIVGMLGIGLLISIKGIHETPLATKPEPIDWKQYVKSLWIDPKQYPDFAWVWITRFLVMIGFYGIQPYINYYLVDVIGIAQDKVDSVAPQLLGVILILATVSGIYGGALSDRIGRKKVVFIANGMIALVTLLFIFCRTLPQTLMVGALFGLFYGAYISVDWALGADVLPNKKDAGKDMAVWHVAMTLPQSLSSPIAAFLIALPGKTSVPSPDGPVYHYTATGYAYVFILCSVAFGLGALLLQKLRNVR